MRATRKNRIGEAHQPSLSTRHLGAGYLVDRERLRWVLAESGQCAAKRGDLRNPPGMTSRASGSFLQRCVSDSLFRSYTSLLFLIDTRCHKLSRHPLCFRAARRVRLQHRGLDLAVFARTPTIGAPPRRASVSKRNTTPIFQHEANGSSIRSAAVPAEVRGDQPSWRRWGRDCL